MAYPTAAQQESVEEIKGYYGHPTELMIGLTVEPYATMVARWGDVYYEIMPSGAFERLYKNEHRPSQ